jgi:CelD/BcsL family acetyltransferase involved in cellulose biosynthesis
LNTPFIELPRDPSATIITPNDLRGCRFVAIPGHPDANRNTPTLQKLNGLIRYVSFRETRFLVSLHGSLSTYLAKFSAKQRHNLLRRVKKFPESSDGKLDCREFRSGKEMLDFQRIAVAISEKTYKKEIGWVFQSSEQFGQELVAAAAVGAVRGYVLYCNGVPAAYAFCRIQNSIVYYTHIGYEPQFANYSPGMVLFYLLIERLFAEARFTYLDFLGGSYWQYKQVLSTVQLPSVTLLYFLPTLSNIALVWSHLTVRGIESWAVRVKALLLEFTVRTD